MEVGTQSPRTKWKDRRPRTATNDAETKRRVPWGLVNFEYCQQVTFDGESVTLNPSVGNWNQDCRSHYVIERNRVIECGQWSDAHVEAERRRDKRAKAAYYDQATASARLDAKPTAPTGDTAKTSGLWSRFRAWFSK